MKVWQGTWDLSGSFVIWGEYRAENPQFDGSTHPFACSADELCEDLERFQFEPEEKTSIQLLLPSTEDGPIPSPRLMVPQDEQEQDVFLKMWDVPALVLSPIGAISFLTSLPAELPPGIKFDHSIDFWLEATKLLLELLTRGRVLPGVRADKGSYYAHWHIIPTADEDTERLSVLAESMPPICRALAEKGSLEPSTILESFLGKSADSVIRSFLRTNPITLSVSAMPSGSKHQLALNWLSQLGERDGELHAPLHELAQLDARLKRWGQALQPATSHAIRTAFRVSPPEENAGEQWVLDFLLQSASNESKALSARDLWRGEIGFLRFSEFTPRELEERFLRDLAKATKLFSPMMRALESAHPTHVVLDTEEAYQFLRVSAPLLDQSGFGVLVPDWWHQPQSQLGLHLQIHSEDSPRDPKAAGLLGMHHLVEFSWELSIGEERIDLDAFRELVDKKSPLVRMGGTWVELSPPEIQSTLEFLEKQKSSSRMRLLDALRYGLGIDSDELGLPVVGLDASGWVQKLLDASGCSIPTLEKPQNFCGDLRPYQLHGLSWLAFLNQIGCGACLADDMGLGKTIQFLALLAYEREVATEPVNPTLLFVPMSILDNWKSEIERFNPSLKIYQHHGPTRLTGKEFIETAQSVDLVITTYSLAHRDEEFISAIKWGRIALDEAQNIKNLHTKQTKAVRNLGALQFTAALNNQDCKRVALTGTPLENHLEELWSVFDFLNPGYLGTVADFRRKFSVPIERYRNDEAAQKLSQIVGPFILRRLKTNRDVIDDLPEKLEMEVYTSLTSEQAAMYQSVVDDMIPQVGHASGIKRKGLVLAAITKLKQICNHPALFAKDGNPAAVRSGKLTRLEELLEVILAEGDHALVFTQFAQMGHLLKSYLQDRFGEEVLFLHGGVQQKFRTKMIERFQSDGGPRIFVLSLKVGGVGLNLTAANQIVHFDQWWNPAVEEQATDRAFRIGQKRNVQVRKFICKGTLEERISMMLNEKRQLADRIVGSTKSQITEFSVDELRDLFELTAEPAK